VVLTGITILAAFSAEFTYRARIDIQVASNLEKQVQAYFHARSAMEIGMMTLTAENEFRKRFPFLPRNLDLWRIAPQFVQIFANQSMSFMGLDVLNLKGAEGLGVEKGNFELEVQSEDSRIPINIAPTDAERRGLFNRLYPILAGEVDPEARQGMDRKAADLILNIIDWQDPDDDRTDIDSAGNLVSAGGAGENTDYSKYGYKARNARFDTVEELRLIEGMTDELFCRFGDDLTVYPTEKINVNGASLQLLKSLICTNLMAASPVGGPNPCQIELVGAAVNQGLDIVERCRRLRSSLFMPPFNNEKEFFDQWRLAGALVSMQIPVDLTVNEQNLRPMIGTRTKSVRLVGRGWVGSSGHQITAVADRGKATYLYWKETGFDAWGKESQRGAKAGDEATPAPGMPGS
jgi:general secretion pathway protein K